MESLEWQYESGADGNITITGHNNGNVVGDVIIPATIEGRPVTSVGRCTPRDGAFDDDLMGYNPIISDGGPISVVIPDGVRSIGNFAFAGCRGLTQVVIPDSVRKIGISAFSGCDGLTSVAIPSGVTEIGEDAFMGCSGLMRVSIPDGIRNVGQGAFDLYPHLEV